MRSLVRYLCFSVVFYRFSLAPYGVRAGAKRIMSSEGPLTTSPKDALYAALLMMPLNSL
jgi:hypothetical protein